MKTARSMRTLAIAAVGMALLVTSAAPAQPRTSGKTGSQALHLPTPGRLPSDPGDLPGSYRFGPPHRTGPTRPGNPAAGLYLVCPIKGLKVINAYGNRINLKGGKPSDPDQPLARQPVGRGGYAVVANGSFTDYVQPLEAVMRKGVLDVYGLPKTRKRGAVAVLEDGTVVVGRQDGGEADRDVEPAIQRAFGRDGKRVVEFMGGGALLIEGGTIVDKEDLRKVQQFDGRIDRWGYPERQFHPAPRTLVGTNGAQAFLIICLNSIHGKDVQAELAGAGFESLVMFDGGRGFFLHAAGRRPLGAGVNPLGLAIQTR